MQFVRWQILIILNFSTHSELLNPEHSKDGPEINTNAKYSSEPTSTEINYEFALTLTGNTQPVVKWVKVTVLYTMTLRSVDVFKISKTSVDLNVIEYSTWN